MADHTKLSDIVTCPLCKGQGAMRKELLVIQSRDPEFRELLARYWDDAASGEKGGLQNPFESREEAGAVHSGAFHGTGTGIPKE